MSIRGAQSNVKAQFVSPPGKNIKPDVQTPGQKIGDAGARGIKQSPGEVSTQRGSRFSNVTSVDRAVRNDEFIHAGADASKDGAEDVQSQSADDAKDDQSEGMGLHKEKKFTGRCRLFVGNLPNDMTETDFRKLFEPYGELNEVFLNSGRGFGFVRLDTRHHAENARAGLDGYFYHSRHIRVRFAAHAAALRVKYLSPHVSNEMLSEAFSMFGELERAVIIVDDRGKPSGEGIVEFARKPGAMTALKRINEGVFLMTSNPRPIAVELLEQSDENDGLPEIFFPKTQDFLKEREQPPRFAQPGSFEYEFGLKWKTLYQMLQEQQELLKKNFEEEVAKMELDMDAALMEQHTAMLRQDLIRRQEELRRLEEQTQMEIQRRLEMRRQQEEERRRQNMDLMDMRRQEELWRQQKQEDDMFGNQMERQMRGERSGLPPPGPERTMLPRPERQPGGPMLIPRTELGIAPPMQPPPVPPTALGMERPRFSGGPGLLGLPGAVNNGDKNVAALMMQQQQRSRFEHPQQGATGPAGDNSRKPAAGGHDEYFDPKRMRRF